MKIKNKILALLMLCFSSQYLSSTNIPAGNISGNLTQAGSPYLILGNITVPQDSLLQIDSGVVIQFQGHYQLKVLGRVLALGTSSNLITFTALNDWWGIRYDGIQPSQDSSLFAYCNIEKGNANGTGNYSNGGAFFILSFSKIRVQNCNIANNAASNYGGAFYCENSSPKLIGNTLTANNAGNAYGGGIYCWNASPSIFNNIMTNNVSSICCRNASSPNIIGNSITHNSLNATIICESSNPSIINNIISFGVLGIYLGNSSPNIIGNAITNHSGWDYGAGIRCRFNSSPLIANNTIANNSSNLLGGGLYTDHSSSPVVKNTILWGNISANGNQLSLDQTSFPSFYNCDIQGGSADFYYYDAPNTFTGIYTNNIDLDPLFVDPSAHNYSLQASSPCINIGDNAVANLPSTDITGFSRICNDIIEIGAFEACAIGVQDWFLDKISVVVYPNPTKSSATLEIFENDLVREMTFQIINIQGKIVKQFYVSVDKTIIPLDEVSQGIYFYQLKTAKDILSTGKIIIE